MTVRAYGVSLVVVSGFLLAACGTHSASPPQSTVATVPATVRVASPSWWSQNKFETYTVLANATGAVGAWSSWFNAGKGDYGYAQAMAALYALSNSCHLLASTTNGATPSEIKALDTLESACGVIGSVPSAVGPGTFTAVSNAVIDLQSAAGGL
jgi:hypothetical protein